MDLSTLYVLALLVAAVILFVTDRIRCDLVAMMVMEAMEGADLILLTSAPRL